MTRHYHHHAQLEGMGKSVSKYPTLAERVATHLWPLTLVSFGFPLVDCVRRFKRDSA